MNGTSPSSSSGQSSPANRDRVLRLARILLYLVLVATVAAIAYAGYKTILAGSELKESQESSSSRFGVQAPRAKHLATEYSDQNGDLLADPPSDRSKLLNPDTLVVGYGEDTDFDVQPVNWDDFKQHLVRITGKTVETRVYTNAPSDVLAVKDGKIHIVALHAADTPYIVNNAGFIPVAVLGSTTARRLHEAAKTSIGSLSFGVDFKSVRSQTSMQQVLELLEFDPVEARGDQLCGACPVHNSTLPSSRSFSANLSTNTFRCFKCHAQGNHLDLWAAATKQTLYDAAVDLCRRVHMETPRVFMVRHRNPAGEEEPVSEPTITARNSQATPASSRLTPIDKSS